MTEDIDVMIVMVEEGIWLWRRNDTLNIVEYQDGSTRAYTPEEIVARDARVAELNATLDREATKTAIRAALTEINTQLSIVQPVIDTGTATAANVKTLARSVKSLLTITKNLVRLI